MDIDPYATNVLVQSRIHLRSLLAQIKPTWWYSMGKVGHECPCCGKLFEHRSDFNSPDGHPDFCTYAQASRHLAEIDSRMKDRQGQDQKIGGQFDEFDNFPG